MTKTTVLDPKTLELLENLNSFYIQQRVRWGEALTQGCWYVLLLVVVLIVFHNILSICVYLILSVYFIMWCATYLSYIYISAGNRRTTTMYLISRLIHVLWCVYKYCCFSLVRIANDMYDYLI